MKDTELEKAEEEEREPSPERAVQVRNFHEAMDDYVAALEAYADNQSEKRLQTVDKLREALWEELRAPLAK